MADMFNSTSYVNHIFILPRHNYVSLLTGVILDPDLDEEELEYQLKILLFGGTQIPPHVPREPVCKHQPEGADESDPRWLLCESNVLIQ